MNYAEKYYAIFDERFKLAQSTSGWFRFSDPSRRKRSNALAVNFKFGKVKDFRNDCVYRIADYLMELDGVDWRSLKTNLTDIDALEIPAANKRYKTAASLPKEWKPITADCAIANKARNMLIGRGHDIDKLDELGFGYCITGKYAMRIIIPYIVDGLLAGFSARAIGHQLPKYTNSEFATSAIFYNEDALHMYSEIFITEGVLDAIATGDDCMARSGLTFSNAQISKLATANKSYIIIPDRGYYKAAIKGALALSRLCRVRIINPDFFEEGKDADDWKRPLIDSALNSAITLSMNNGIKILNDDTFNLC
jgi:hypothetical protein